MKARCFVTGTDTEVGKTRISAGLLHLWARQGWQAVGVKPVAAGGVETAEGWVNEDVQLLMEAASVPVSATEVGPVQLRAACAPHIAAAQESVRLDRAACVAHVRHMATRAEAVLVEGVGGFCVPLSTVAPVPCGADDGRDRWGMDDVAADLGWPVVLVVGLRLGCLNHALLTAQAIAARGLRLAGWVGNGIDPDMPFVADNLSTLRQWLPAPCLGVVPWLSVPGPQAVADALDAQAVLEALSRVEAVGPAGQGLKP